MSLSIWEEYLRSPEPTQREKAYAWSTAIGLQDVDGLRPSSYLLENVQKHIEGEISLTDVEARIDQYYQAIPSPDTSTEEADKVALRINELLSEAAFTFSVREYMQIHYRLFKGIYNHAGQLRNYNITKKEWVLDDDTVTYGSASHLLETLQYDLDQEKAFSYKGLSQAEVIGHLAKFTANLWQIHAFGEGNTRTTAVFLIKYLRTLGYTVTNDTFARHSWYFRNALVRANYNNIPKGIYETQEFLLKFFENLLLGTDHELQNRHLHIYAQPGVREIEGLSYESVDYTIERGYTGD